MQISNPEKLIFTVMIFGAIGACFMITLGVKLNLEPITISGAATLGLIIFICGIMSYEILRKTRDRDNERAEAI